MACKNECMEQKKDGTLKDCPILKENEGLKRNLKRYSEKIAEQEETIDAQDEKINFYVSKMNKALTEGEQLKKEISVLLSCSNCSENKGGYICEKEYSDKCLAQKIEYIKELKEQIEKMKDCKAEILQRIDEACIGALNAEVRAIFKKWELTK